MALTQHRAAQNCVREHDCAFTAWGKPLVQQYSPVHGRQCKDDVEEAVHIAHGLRPACIVLPPPHHRRIIVIALRHLIDRIRPPMLAFRSCGQHGLPSRPPGTPRGRQERPARRACPHRGVDHREQSEQHPAGERPGGDRVEVLGEAVAGVVARLAGEGAVAEVHAVDGNEGAGQQAAVDGGVQGGGREGGHEQEGERDEEDVELAVLARGGEPVEEQACHGEGQQEAEERHRQQGNVPEEKGGRVSVEGNSALALRAWSLGRGHASSRHL